MELSACQQEELQGLAVSCTFKERSGHAPCYHAPSQSLQASRLPWVNGLGGVGGGWEGHHSVEYPDCHILGLPSILLTNPQYLIW